MLFQINYITFLKLFSRNQDEIFLQDSFIRIVFSTGSRQFPTLPYDNSYDAGDRNNHWKLNIRLLKGILMNC